MNKQADKKYNEKRPVFGYRPKNEEREFLELLMSEYKMNKHEVIEYLVRLGKKNISGQGKSLT